MLDKPIKKLYYSIGEVSEITSLEPYVLRYWETEFSQLHPPKNKAGNRVYKARDLKLVLLIKDLLYVQKYTIEGARLQIEKREKEDQVIGDLEFEREIVHETDGNKKEDGKIQQSAILEVKKELRDILKILDQ